MWGIAAIKRAVAVTVTSNASGSPHSAALSGTGVAAPPPPPPAPAATIPTLSEWGLLGLMLALIVIGTMNAKRRARKQA